MATLRDIKSRIKGVTNTQQITKAMKMVAAARLRRAQENMINARPYSRKIAEVLSNLIASVKGTANPLFDEREVNENIAIVVVTSDRGLAGGFNMNAIRRAEELITDEYSEQKENGKLFLYCVGKKGVDYFSRRNYNIVGAYSGIFSDLKFEFASTLTTELTTKFLNNEYDKVIIVYNEFKSVIQQNTLAKQILPIAPFDDKVIDDEEVKIPDFIFEPDKISIIDTLLPRHLKAQVWIALLNSYAAELGARMTAMDMATENAKELIRSLKIVYNKERQAAITTEISEIVSGANALKDV